MKNLSLGSKVRYLQGATLGLFLLLGILMGSATGLPALTWVLYGLLLVLMGIVFYTVHRILAAIRVLTRNVRAAAEGNLDQRITGIKPGAATGGLAWAFNDLLDQQEAYFREVIAAFEHASRGQTYRLAMDQGLHGAFKEAMVRVNVAVESLGKVQQMALKEHLMSRVMNLNAASLNTNLKSVQAYLLNMTQELGTVGDLSATTAREAEDSRATLERLVVNLNRVVAMVGDTHSQISVLHQKGEEIAQIVQVITEVADRTNLLALNAAIEAAHAGEVGKGFAVVAEEVRTLSENTKDAAASIAATIESFGQATTRMLHDSEQVKELAEGSQGAVTEFRVKVLSFAESAQTSQKQVAKSQDFSFAALVKMDHFLYMQNGYRLVNQGTHSDEAQMFRTDHRGCRLGTWYYTGQGAELFSHLPSFNRLEEPHAAVHHNIHEVIHLLDQDWVRDQGVRDRIFHHFQSAEQASHAVVEAIDRLVAEKHA